MKKYLLILVLCPFMAMAQQPVQVSYETVNRQFQKELSILFQNFVDQQSAQGNEVIVSFYDNFGEERVSKGTAGTPSYLKAISNYKVKFMRTRQLQSTKNVLYVGNTQVADSERAF